MAQQIIGAIPPFTSDEGVEEEKEQEVTPVETQEIPQTQEETKIEEEHNEESASPEVSEAPNTLNREQVALQALQQERAKLLKEISELRGSRRELKQDQINLIEKRIDELNDVNPDDVNLIEKVLRAKGYVTKEETNKMVYESIKNEELGKFLEKYPEYKPENDPSDTNWSLLTRELGFYRLPEDPHRINEVLERAHRGIVRVSTSPQTQVKKQRIETASRGSGGVQRSRQFNSLDPVKVEMLKRGGFTDEDIKKIEDRL